MSSLDDGLIVRVWIVTYVSDTYAGSLIFGSEEAAEAAARSLEEEIPVSSPGHRRLVDMEIYTSISSHEIRVRS